MVPCRRRGEILGGPRLGDAGGRTKGVLLGQEEDAPALEVSKAGMDGALGSLAWCRGGLEVPPHPSRDPPRHEGMGPAGPCLLTGGRRAGFQGSQPPWFPSGSFSFRGLQGGAVACGGCVTASTPGAPFGAPGRSWPMTQGTSPGLAGWPRACGWPRQEKQPPYPASGSPIAASRRAAGTARARLSRGAGGTRLCAAASAAGGSCRCRRRASPAPTAAGSVPVLCRGFTRPWGERESDGCGVGRSPPLEQGMLPRGAAQGL